MIFRLVQSIGKKMKKQLGSVDSQVNLCCLQTVRQLSLCLCPVHLRTFHLRFCITIAMLTKYLPKRFKQFPSHFKAIFWIFVFLLCDRAFHSNFHCRNISPPDSRPKVPHPADKKIHRILNVTMLLVVKKWKGAQGHQH